MIDWVTSMTAMKITSVTAARGFVATPVPVGIFRGARLELV
jgi:hypothetical protein